MVAGGLIVLFYFFYYFFLTVEHRQGQDPGGGRTDRLAPWRCYLPLLLGRPHEGHQLDPIYIHKEREREESKRARKREKSSVFVCLFVSE